METGFLRWLGHASFLIDIDGMNVYVDPFRLSTVKERADLILITHPHFDHMSMDDIKKIADSKTEIFVTKDSVGKINIGKVRGVEPGKSYSSQGFEFSTIPAYNVVKERLDKHPKANRWVGYILDTGEGRVYHAGDTDFIDEMKEIEVDLALLPMSGTYTMDVNEAIRAANSINAKYVAPMHYRAVLGKEAADEAERKFKNGVKNSVLLKEVQEPYNSF